MKLKKVLSLALAVTLVAGTTLLSACGKEEKASIDKLTVTYVTSPLNVPSIVDKEKGLIKEALGDVEVEYAEITSGSEQTQALASGDVQILHAVGGSSVVSAAAAGADIKIISMYSRAPKAFTMYAKDNSIKSAKDLKGKKIAGPIGTNLHELLVAYLAKDGMTIEDVDYVNMQIPDAFAALQSGSIDVALLGGAAAVNAQNAGFHKIADGEGLIEAIIATATTQKFYDEHKDVIDAFMKAQENMRKFMDDNKDDVKAMVVKALGIDDAGYETMLPQYDFSLDIKDKDIEGLQKTADFMFQNKMIEKEVTAKELFVK